MITIKVYVNGELYICFDNQQQLDVWAQAQDKDFFLENEVFVDYEEDATYF